MTAALFDLDGTLVDNMRVHLGAWKTVFAELGVTVDEARMHRDFSGRKNEEIIPAVLGRRVGAAELDAIALRKETLYRELYRPHVSLAPGAAALIERLRASGVKVAIASAAPPDNRSFILNALGIEPWFDAIVGAEEAARGKPAPDLFLLAAKRVGIAPERCVVFEDAVNGIKAAIAAGSVAVGITTVESAEALSAAGARWTLPDFTPLPGELLALLGIK